MSPPLCKVCGKPIPRVTRYTSFGCKQDNRSHTNFIDLEARPADLEEATRLAGNGRVINVVRSGFYGRGAAAAPGAITGLTTWDGESYSWGGHFHAQSCAAKFGRGMADQYPTYTMPAYREAMAARAKKEESG